MASETNKKTKESLQKKKKIEWYYLNDSVKSYDFSDYVRLRSTPHGMILSFGKMQGDEGKFAVFKEILVPYEVAEALSNIIKGSLGELVEKGALRAIAPNKEKSK